MYGVQSVMRDAYGIDALLHLVSTVHGQKIGRIGVSDSQCISCIRTIVEYQYGGIGCIAQRQDNVMHSLLVVDDNAVCPQGGNRQ